MLFTFSYSSSVNPCSRATSTVTSISFNILYDDLLSEKMRQNIYDPMMDLIKEMNPELEIDNINHLLDENLRLLQDFYNRVSSWLKDKYPLLYNSRLDLASFMRFVAHYSIFHEELSDNLKIMRK